MTSSRDIEKKAKGLLYRHLMTVITHGVAVVAGVVVGILL